MEEGERSKNPSNFREAQQIRMVALILISWLSCKVSKAEFKILEGMPLLIEPNINT